MNEIEYNCKLFKKPITYKLVNANGAYLLYHESTLIAQVKMKGNKCIQIGGRQISDEMLKDISKLI